MGRSSHRTASGTSGAWSLASLPVALLRAVQGRSWAAHENAPPGRCRTGRVRLLVHSCGRPVLGEPPRPRVVILRLRVDQLLAGQFAVAERAGQPARRRSRKPTAAVRTLEGDG